MSISKNGISLRKGFNKIKDLLSKVLGVINLALFYGIVRFIALLFDIKDVFYFLLLTFSKNKQKESNNMSVTLTNKGLEGDNTIL
ncbi:MAG: hypothetical protein LBL74_03400 [Bacteroidales bacterium]|jgi:hypothetical protein|nr:hypothetical protein [Bacteroidales bacterium]